METRPTYGSHREIREKCLQPYSDDWEAPVGREISAALSMAGWSQSEFGRRIGVNSRTVRRWALDERDIPYAAWCVLCSQAALGNIWQ